MIYSCSASIQTSSVSNIASFFNDQIVKPTTYLTHCGLLCSSVMMKSLHMFYYQKHSDGNIICFLIRNIVCTVNLDCKLDLKNIALRARNAEYNPKRFAAVIMRIRDPRTTALIFSSGKMVCTGAKRFVLVPCWLIILLAETLHYM